jgi:hypothetical protein
LSTPQTGRRTEEIVVVKVKHFAEYQDDFLQFAKSGSSDESQIAMNLSATASQTGDQTASQPNIGNLPSVRMLVSTSHCALCTLPLRFTSRQSAAGETANIEAFIETTETPDFIAAEVNGTTHVAVDNVRWFGSLVERNNRAKDGDRTVEMILSGSVLLVWNPSDCWTEACCTSQ